MRTEHINLTPMSIMQENLQWWSSYYNAVNNPLDRRTIKAGAHSCEEVFAVDKARLKRYGEKNAQCPLMISYALVNRYTVADLQKDRSLIGALVKAGLTVYVIDWGYPDPADRFLSLDDYVNDYIDSCVDKICSLHNTGRINILGICQGGTLALCYGALNPDKVNALITMVTPVDFHTEDDRLSKMVQSVDVDLAVKAFGNIPGEALNANFSMLQPISLNWKKHIDSVKALAQAASAEFFLTMEDWINDSPDQAGLACCQFIQQFYQGNHLVNDKAVIGGQPVQLRNLARHPVLNVYGTQDHLVPPQSSMALKQFIDADNYQEIAVETGHIGMYVSSKARAVPENIFRWLRDSGHLN